MRLETMTPDPSAHPDEGAVARLAALDDDVSIHVWGGDWCKDCVATLPKFAAALVAAGIDPDSTYQYPVTKREDGSKVGPAVEAYDIEYIPTIVVERAGVEIARFVESADEPAAVYLANRLAVVDRV